MQRLREFLTLALLLILPFHAIAITIATLLLLGPGHPPLTILAVWKEALLAIILLVACVEILMRRIFRIDLIDCLVGVLLIIGVTVSLYRPWSTQASILLGIRYDFVALAAFLVARRVEWSTAFRRQSTLLFIALGVLLSAYGIVTFFLPPEFFTRLGYSAAHSLYMPSSPLAAFQQISGAGIRRIQGTFAGPNQFGIWLLIPLSFCLAQFVRNGKWKVENGKLFTICHLPFSVFCIALFLTFSRSAWIAAAVISSVLLYRAVPRHVFTQIAISAAAVGVLLVVAASVVAPSLLIRRTSTWGHLVRPLHALAAIRQYPLGMGLGQAGPAANRTSEPCVYLEPGADPAWAASLPKLCVFVGSVQRQPTDRQCHCPLLPENWYLQIGVEMGVIGFFLYLALIVLVLMKLRVARFEAVFLFFLGVCIACLFLHAWEDSAVAYSAWLLVAAALPFSPSDRGPAAPASAKG